MEVDTPVFQPLKYTLSVRLFRSCPWNEVRECLHSAPLQVTDYDSVDNMWSFCQGILLGCLESFAPVKTVNCNSSRHQLAPWLSSSLLEAIRRKQ